jgi:metal-responsive CopG/Arc/MetJ family transcriptional regulator
LEAFIDIQFCRVLYYKRIPTQEGVMAVMTIKDDIYQKVERLVPNPTSREELINNLISGYVRDREEFERLCAECMAIADDEGITEEDINQAIREVREEEERLCKP